MSTFHSTGRICPLLAWYIAGGQLSDIGHCTAIEVLNAQISLMATRWRSCVIVGKNTEWHGNEQVADIRQHWTIKQSLPIGSQVQQRPTQFFLIYGSRTKTLWSERPWDSSCQWSRFQLTGHSCAAIVIRLSLWNSAHHLTTAVDCSIHGCDWAVVNHLHRNKHENKNIELDI